MCRRYLLLCYCLALGVLKQLLDDVLVKLLAGTDSGTIAGILCQPADAIKCNRICDWRYNILGAQTELGNPWLLGRWIINLQSTSVNTKTTHVRGCFETVDRASEKATTHHNLNCFTALFPGPPRWAGARRELLDFMVQRKINRNRGRHTDHPAGYHYIQTNQCPPPPSPIFFTGRIPFLPPNQQRQSP